MTDLRSLVSDIDVLLTFNSQHRTSWADRIEMQEKVEQLLGRNVDLVNPKNLKHPYRRHQILTTCKAVYAAERSRHRIRVGYGSSNSLYSNPQIEMSHEHQTWQ